jgi:hypothetical protein
MAALAVGAFPRDDHLATTDAGHRSPALAAFLVIGAPTVLAACALRARFVVSGASR